MNIFFLVFILLLQLTLTTKSFGENTKFYSQYCPPNLASLSAGGISIVKPIQTAGLIINNNPAGITQNDSSYISGESAKVNRNTSGFDEKDNLMEQEIADDPNQNIFYGYQGMILGYISSPKNEHYDTTNDYFIFHNLKRKNLYWAAVLCVQGEELVYNIQRKSNNDKVKSGYSTTYNKIDNAVNNVKLTWGYKEFSPGLDLGLNLNFLISRFQNKYNLGFEDGYDGHESSIDNSLNDGGDFGGFGIGIGAIYNLPKIPKLSIGAIAQVSNTFNVPDSNKVAFPISEVGVGGSWSYLIGRYEWINTAELLNVTAKGDKIYNWTEEHIGSDFKIKFNNILWFPNMVIRAGINRGKPAGGVEFYAVRDTYRNFNLYFGYASGQQIVGIGSIKVINKFDNIYWGLKWNI